MTDVPRVSRVVRVAAGRPRVPEPHPADYSTPIPDANLKLIEELCDQKVLSSGKILQRFEW